MGDGGLASEARAVVLEDDKDGDAPSLSSSKTIARASEASPPSPIKSSMRSKRLQQLLNSVARSSTYRARVSATSKRERP